MASARMGALSKVLRACRHFIIALIWLRNASKYCKALARYAKIMVLYPAAPELILTKSNRKIRRQNTYNSRILAQITIVRCATVPTTQHAVFRPRESRIKDMQIIMR